MKRHSSIDALGDTSLVHLLEIELSPDVLGGARTVDPFDGERIREAANLLKRVCSKQKIAGDYAVTAVRGGSAGVRCGFLDVRERDLVGDIAGAIVTPPLQWASRRSCLLDRTTEETLNAAGIPRDNKSAGRRFGQKAKRDEEDRGLRWKVQGNE